MKDKLHFWSEKFPLALAMAAQALVVTRWYLSSLGSTMMPLGVIAVVTWATVAIAVAAGVALDLVVVTTVMARREGRRGPWGIITAAAAALASAFIALDVYGGWSPGPYLHVAYPVVVFCFAMHLSAPRARERSASHANRRARLATTLRSWRAASRTLAGVTAQLASAEASARVAQSTAASADAEAREQARQVRELRAELANAEATVASALAEAVPVREEAASIREEHELTLGRLADARGELAKADRENDRLARQLASEQRERAELAAQLATARTIVPGLAAIKAYVRERQAADVPLATVAKELGFNESTVRGWLKAETNGHALEAV